MTIFTVVVGKCDICSPVDSQTIVLIEDSAMLNEYITTANIKAVGVVCSSGVSASRVGIVTLQIIDSDARDSERSWICNRKGGGGRVYDINFVQGARD